MSFWHNLVNKDFEDKLIANNCLLPELTVNAKPGVRNEEECLKLEWGDFMRAVEGINVYDIYRHCY